MQVVDNLNMIGKFFRPIVTFFRLCIKYIRRIIAFVIICFLGYAGALHWSAEDVKATIIEKDSKKLAGETKDSFLVGLEYEDGSGETVRISDTWIFFKWCSSDQYMRMARNGEYNMTLAGFRIRWISGFRNVISVEGIECPIF